MKIDKIDIKENKLFEIDNIIFNILLKDNTTGKNIIWATDIYEKKGASYRFNNQIFDYLITGNNGELIKPRVKKTKEEQENRIRNKAEVFTPSWMCNLQNNVIDAAWFGRENVFNIAEETTWNTIEEIIVFPEGKNWKDYITDIRMEVSCGEAPYLVSRYDTVTGDVISVKNRIGLLDRKLRIISENINSEEEWIEWCIKAYKSVYGYEWQGDNLFLARENLLYTFVDYYYDKFNKIPSIDIQREIATIISWNIWQMDGIKYVIPCSCKNEEPKYAQINLFGEEEVTKVECLGCKKDNYRRHNGIYSKIMNWNTNRSKMFYKIVEEGSRNGRK